MAKFDIKRLYVILLIVLVVAIIFEISFQLLNFPYSPSKPDPFIGLEGDSSLFHETKDANSERIYRFRADKLAYFNDEEFSKEKPKNVFLHEKSWFLVCGFGLRFAAFH